jgi:hypothetical protein
LVGDHGADEGFWALWDITKLYVFTTSKFPVILDGQFDGNVD